MRLFYTATSPFVRKVLVAAHELGIENRIETTFLRPSPLKTDATLSAVNPLSKIPALVLDDGMELFDSTVICEYLDSFQDRPKLIPAAGAERWRVLRGQALCDGILDAGILFFYEKKLRPDDRQWGVWLEGQRQKVEQGLDVLERDVDTFSKTVDLAAICAGVTLGWLEFRAVAGEIRAKRPRLFAWYDVFRQRASMAKTTPHE